MSSVALDSSITPKHVAIIMDGNGRWAKARGLPRTAGHKKGVDAVKNTIEAAIKSGVNYLTLFGFSSENWQRPQDEVSDLMILLRHYLRHEIGQLVKQSIRLKIIGDRSRFDGDIQTMMQTAEEQTKAGHKLILTIALGYGGRQELTSAMAQMLRDGVDPDSLTIEKFAGYLQTSELPDPDVLIRTSGEKRISNFLLWQLAYTELVFLDVLWPDFSAEYFAEALGEFARRERRFGG